MGGLSPTWERVIHKCLHLQQLYADIEPRPIFREMGIKNAWDIDVACTNLIYIKETHLCILD